MVEDVVRVEPLLFGSQEQHTSIARKIELWRRIVDRVNAVGQNPRNREDIRKRWNDLRGKVRSTVSRHNIAVQRTDGGPPPQPPQLTTWEEQVLTIMHPEGLRGVGGGWDTGSRRTVTTPEGPDNTTPPTEEAHSDDSSSALLEPDDQPGPSWASGQSVLLAQAQPNTDLPSSGNTSTAPSQRARTSLPRTGQSAVCPPLQGTQGNPPPQQQQGPEGSGSGHTVQGTEAQEHRGTGRAAVRQGADRPRDPTLHEALSSIMGAYHHSQETMATVLVKFQETQRLQADQYLGFRVELRTIIGVLKDIQQTLRDTVALQGAPDTSQDDELPTTSAGASGQDAPPQDHHTSTPLPADRQPPCKRSLRARNRTEQDGKTPARK
ncbi:hypothetical protein NDU88_003089 [Pleurodeles waltl]|uniref:Myb/SANT-like DNA-binding domain-containing protein n=1 Tax=Pleurodeles waltl TaxID=8319 RepID=A0AAV7VED5_PLEWA|nr:hypothetical protein NDU88_003089 [Pleurodeles waltl]